MKSILTNKDYKFIEDFGKRYNIVRGNGFYLLIELVLNEYKKYQKECKK